MRHSRMNCAASAMSRCAGAGCRSTGWRRMQARSRMWATRCSTSAVHATSISCISTCRRRRRRFPPACRWSSRRIPASAPGGTPCAAIKCRRTGSGSVTLTGRGLRRADVVLVPTRGHGDALRRIYGPLAQARVIVAMPRRRTRRQCRRAVRAGGRALVGRRQECRHARRRRRPRRAGLWSWRARSTARTARPSACGTRRRSGELSRAALSALMRRAAVFASAALLRAVRPRGAGGGDARVRRSCLPTSRPSASCGMTRRCSSQPTMRQASPRRSTAWPMSRRCAAASPRRARERAGRFTLGRQVGQVRQAYAAALATHAQLAAD